MKKITVVILFTFLITWDVFSQNVGIGTTTPTRAKLEVNGAVGYTSAIFGGESTGISTMLNNPGIGFNDYFSTTHKYIANGYSAVQWLDAINGGMFIDMFSYGTTNSEVITANRSITFNTNGNIGIRSPGYSDISLFVPRLSNFSGALVIGGSAHNSRFNFGSFEDTYIRGGINGSTVIINDISNGNIQLGGGSSRVGINTLPYSPATALEINGGLSLRTSLVNITTPGATVTVGDRSYINLTNTTPSWTSFAITNGINAGQILILASDISNGGARFLGISNGSNIKLYSSGFQMWGGYTMTLIWNGTFWLETSRSANSLQ